jgi:hypothetical protein
LAIASSSARSTSLPIPMITRRTGRVGSASFLSSATRVARLMPSGFLFAPSVKSSTELTLPPCQLSCTFLYAASAVS